MHHAPFLYRDVYSASTNMYYSTLLMIALFVTGTINSVVSKRMFDAYTDKYAYFANQVGKGWWERGLIVRLVVTV